MNASTISYWIRTALSVLKDYKYSQKSDNKIISKEDFDELVDRLEKIIAILESNQSKFNMIISFIKLINSVKGTN